MEVFPAEQLQQVALHLMKKEKNGTKIPMEIKLIHLLTLGSRVLKYVHYTIMKLQKVTS